MSRTNDTIPFSDNADTEIHAASPTAHLLEEPALCSHRPGQDELFAPNYGTKAGQDIVNAGGCLARTLAELLVLLELMKGC